MILHLGNDVFVKLKHVLMILEYEEAASNKDTSLFLSGLKKHIIDEHMVKAVVVTDENGLMVYCSPISPATLLKRCGDPLPFADAVPVDS
ncbi:MAG: extracellular matrix regulator RemB [Christensenellaceae bacterium]